MANETDRGDRPHQTQETSARSNPEPDAPRSPEPPDPTVPHDRLPEERPGTEASVRNEVEAVSVYQGWAEIEGLRAANKVKNQGVRFQLPRYTLQPPPVIRLRPLTHGMLSVAQGEERKRVRRTLRLKENRELPTIGRIELHRRLIIRSLMEWCEGESDIEGAVEANRIKNAGLRYAFPRTMLRGVVLRLRPLSHFSVMLARAEAEERIRRGLGLTKPDEELPPEATFELRRAMIEAAVLEWCEGDVTIRGERFNLIGADRWEVRKWVRDNFLPPANLRDKPPRDDAEREEFFEEMFADLNTDFLEEIATGLDQIRTADPWEILARGDDFTAGADWEYEGKASYEPRSLVSWADRSPRELQRLMAETFFPPIDLTVKPPPGRAEREAFYEEQFDGFHNELLNEFLEGQEMIQDADPEDLLEKGSDFTVGAPASSGSSG